MNQNIFVFFKQVSSKENVGTDIGAIYNKSNKKSDAPQDSPEDAWVVALHEQSKEIQKEYNASSNGWASDSTLKIQVIEW